MDSYYAQRRKKFLDGKSRIVPMHREILGLEYGDKRKGDHIDHDTLYNCRNNLRVVTHRQNLSNHKKETSSVYTGVSWDNKYSKWRVQIMFKRKRKHLGYFDNELDAYKAYVKFAEEHEIEVLRVA